LFRLRASQRIGSTLQNQAVFSEGTMQYQLRSLFILMGLIGVYFGILNMPTMFAFPLFSCLVLVTPAYWLTGAIYARDRRQAFFVGGIAAGAFPYLMLAYYCINMGRWGWAGFERYRFGETQIVNVMLSLLVCLPILLAFAGGWIGIAVYRSLRAAESDEIASAHLQPIVKRPHPLDKDYEPAKS
jgi:hypothetical protein